MKRPAVLLTTVLVIGVLLLSAWRLQGPVVEGSFSSKPAKPTAALHPFIRVGSADASATTNPRQTATPAAKTKSKSVKPEYLVLIVLDGGRPEYFDVPSLPHLDQLIRNGTSYSNGWAGILESETPSGHATIATGSEPRDDGILSFSWANSDNTAIDLFDPNKVRQGDMEHIMKQAGAPTIASLVHSKDRSAKVVALGGHKYYASDAMGGPNADVIMYYAGNAKNEFAPNFIPGHGPPAGVFTPDLTYKTTSMPLGMEDHLAMKLAVNTFDKMQEKVTLINEPEFDYPVGHVDGASRDPKDVATLMHQFDSDLAMLEDKYRKAGVLDRTLFVVTADHGFSPIYHTVSKTDLTKAVSDAGTSIVTDTYHTASYLWIKDRNRANAVAANIAKLRNPYIQSVYFKQYTSGRFSYVRATGGDLLLAPGMEAANQYLLRTFNGPNGPDVAVFFTEDSASLPDGQIHWKGDHGGNDWNAQHLPLVISGPGVRRGYVSNYPAPLMDIAPTVLSLLGIPAKGMQGVPLADSIASASKTDKANQQGQGKWLAPVITSLQKESDLELKAGR